METIKIMRVILATLIVPLVFQFFAIQAWGRAPTAIIGLMYFYILIKEID